MQHNVLQEATVEPTDGPTSVATGGPTDGPTERPTGVATGGPTDGPTERPTGGATGGTTNGPTSAATTEPEVVNMCDECKNLPPSPVCGPDGRNHRTQCEAVYCAGIPALDLSDGPCQSVVSNQ